MTKSRGILLPFGLSAAFLLFLFCLLRPLSSIYATGDVLCVVPPGAATGPFAACDQVFTSVQAAINTAVPHSEIRVAGGVYTDVQGINGRYQIAYIDKSLGLHGGYAIPFDDPPDPAQHITTLDAGGWGRVLLVEGDIDVAISGLHLTGGAARVAGINGSGGGVYVTGATILLQDNVIADNWFSDAQTGYGGGVYLLEADATLRHNHIRHNVGYGSDQVGGGVAARHSTLTLQNNVIVSNTATTFLPNGFGGPLSGFAGGVYAFASQVTIENNIIAYNQALAASGVLHPWNAQGYGGGMALVESSGYAGNNQILQNVAADEANGYGGGIYIEGAGTLVLAHNFIEENIASDSGEVGSGGGIVLFASPTQAPSVTLYDNLIANNSGLISGTLGMGGGAAILFGSYQGLPRPVITLTHNLILSNTAVITGGTGLGGGVVAGAAGLYLDQNEVIGNFAGHVTSNGQGGGLFLAGNQAHLTRNVIRHNHASHAGSGLVLEEGVTVLENSAIVDNQGSLSSSGLHLICGATLEATHVTFARNVGSAIHLAQQACNQPQPVSSTAVFTNTIIANQSIGASVAAFASLRLHGVLWHETPVAFQAAPGTQVVVSHQRFGNPGFTADGYHITANSPARFNGLATGLLVDIDGQPRPSLHPALGADEYWAVDLFLPLIRR